MTSPADTSKRAASPPNSWVGVGVMVLWLASGMALATGYAPGPLTFAFVVLGWILSVMAHELGHAWVAYRGGDHTILEKGYLSFDPRRFGDLGTSVVIPLIALALGGIGFPGGAVYLRNDLMRGPLWRSAAALAGPAATLFVMLVLAAVLDLVGERLDGFCYEALAFLTLLQAMALILNLLPIPGLDGFAAIRPFLPQGLNKAIRTVERFALIALLLILFGAPGASAALFRAASAIVVFLDVPAVAWARGYQAFHFWN